jgi:glucokinase
MKCAIGVDFGGTKIEGSIISERGAVKDTYRVPTQASKGRKQIINNIVTVIQHLKSKRRVAGVGISMPGFIDHTGKVVFGGGTLTSLQGVNLKKELERRVKLPVFIENDANCFALAEAAYGAGKKHRVVLGVIWGTGIGSGIVIDKHVFSGSFGGAGEFGHIVIDPTITKGPKCGCGQRGCLEILASGKNIMRRYKKAKGKIPNANPRQIYFSNERVAKQVIADAVHYLGIGLATAVNILNPGVIVLGGGVSKLPKPVYGRLKKEVKKYALPSLTKKLKVLRHSISDAAGTIGAAALVLKR